MAQYLTRVELHGAITGDYDKLHKAMALQGFTRTIVGADGREFHLPTAEYNIFSPLTAEQVRDKAGVAAASVRSSYDAVTALLTAWAGHFAAGAIKKYG